MNSEKTYKGGGRGERRRGKAHTPIIISILDVHLLKGASSSPFLNTNGRYVVFVWTRLSESACFVYCPPAASHPLPYYYSSSSSSFSIGADTCVCIIYICIIHVQLLFFYVFFATCFPWTYTPSSLLVSRPPPFHRQRKKSCKKL